MEELAREVARLAYQVQQDIEELRRQPTQPTRSDESTDSTARVLGRIEEKVTAVHGHTSELIQRVPVDLGRILEELRRALILRLEEVVEANGSTGSSTGQLATDSTQSSMSAMKSLARQERRVFQLCFQCGFLSYGEIARHLEITPSAAKNLINRIFQSDSKRRLFAKQYEHGSVRVAVHPEMKREILQGDGSRNKKPVRAKLITSE